MSGPDPGPGPWSGSGWVRVRVESRVGSGLNQGWIKGWVRVIKVRVESRVESGLGQIQGWVRVESRVGSGSSGSGSNQGLGQCHLGQGRIKGWVRVIRVRVKSRVGSGSSGSGLNQGLAQGNQGQGCIKGWVRVVRVRVKSRVGSGSDPGSELGWGVWILSCWAKLCCTQKSTILNFFWFWREEGLGVRVTKVKNKLWLSRENVSCQTPKCVGHCNSFLSTHCRNDSASFCFLSFFLSFFLSLSLSFSLSISTPTFQHKPTRTNKIQLESQLSWSVLFIIPTKPQRLPSQFPRIISDRS